MTALVDRPATDGPRPSGRRRRRFDWLGIGLPALIAYIPLLFTHPGMVGADTKTYLYLDPGKLLSEAPYLWNSDIGLGSVTHQNIGYLWPMGPFYFVFQTLGVPDWIAQRLWMGSLIFAAGMGVRFLVRTLGWGRLPLRKGGVLVATLAYMLSPYLLNYSARISVILLPWCALPWLIALTARALRRGGWRDPALFALIVLTVGGVNATALLLIGLGPLLWIIHAVAVDREVSVRRALIAALRIGVLTVAASLWWVAGLAAQGRFGLPVVNYTETYKVVASASSAPEVLRGLGYWLFYGSDKLGQWIEPSVTYTTPGWMALSYGIPLLAMAAAAMVRWRYRAFFLLLVAVGALASIASYPWDDASLLGAIFKEVTRTEAGLSLRSTPRAVPLLALGLSVCLGAGVAAIGRRVPRLNWPVTALVAALVVANLSTLWNGQMVAENLERPEDVPAYWFDTARHLTATDDGTRAIEVPGADFASYRWGNTIDPVTPGLTERQYAANELFLWGSPQAADLALAFDQRWQEDTMDPEAIAPIARLLGGGDIVLRNDLMYERYRLARPRQMWELLNRAPGLDPPIGFGPTTPNIAGPEFPLIDEIELATPATWEHPPAVAVFGVQDRLAPVRSSPAQRPLLVSGNGDGLVDLAGVGGLDPNQSIFYSASFATDALGLARALDERADLVVTDTNRKRARTWNTLRESAGYTEQAGETSLTYTPGDQRLDVFPGATDDAYTVTEQQGGLQVFATGYGNRGTLTVNDRPSGALDGDVFTAWRAADGQDSRGQRLIVVADQPVTTDHVDLLQPQAGVRTRWITRARLTFDGADPVEVDLTDASRTGSGQRVDVGPRTFSRLDVEILADSAGDRQVYDGESGVGFAEVGVGGLRLREVIRPPVDLLDAAGAGSATHRLSYVFTRLRTNPGEPVRSDPETSLVRVVEVPTARVFGLGGQARLSAGAADDVVDVLLGMPSAADGGITIWASDSLPGSLVARGSAALDGNRETAWSTPFGSPSGQWVDVTLPAARTVDRMDLQVVTDGRHSVPTRITVTVDGDPGSARGLALPVLADGGPPGSTTSVPLTFEPLTGSSFRVSIDEVRPVTTIDWYTERPIPMPSGIAELGLPGIMTSELPMSFDSGCRSDLITIDGQAVPVRITGSTSDALARRGLDVGPCSPGEATIEVALDAGSHLLTTAVGRDLGLDLDRLVLSSDRDGTALPLAALALPVVEPTAPIGVVRDGGVTWNLTVPGTESVQWLSFGQSWNPGWQASVDGRSLGPSTVIDGYANGWRLDPAELGPGPWEIRVTWAPQRTIWIAIAISGLAVALCIALIAVAWWRDRRRITGDDADLLLEDASAAQRSGHRALPLDPELAPLPLLTGARHGVVERAPRRAAVVGAVVLATVMAVNVPVRVPDLLIIPVVAIMAGIAFRSPRGRGVLGLGAVASYGLASAYIVALQWRRGQASEFFQIVAPVHVLALAAVYLLLAEGVRDLLVRRHESDSP